jgi:ABC-type bacteriocin/lantibiotic exporter with double-glycine peptidase domain
MTINFTNINRLKQLWGFFSSRRQFQFKLLFVLMVVASSTEVLSIGAILPFLGVLTNPDRIYESSIAKPLIEILNINASSELVIPVTVIFCTVVFISAAIRLLLLWASSKLTYIIGADLNSDIYRKTLYQPYTEHIKKNSSDLISIIGFKSQEIIVIINQVVILLSSLLIIFAVSIALLLIEPLVTLSAFIGIVSMYAIVIRITHKRLVGNSEKIAINSSNAIRSLQEGLGAIRDILIHGTQELYSSIFYQTDLSLRRAQADNIFIGGTPRYMVEALSMIIIATLACGIAIKTEGISGAIPILGALALGAQRLLPLVQSSYLAWTIINGAQATLDNTLTLLAQRLPDFSKAVSAVESISFNEGMSLRNVSFRYENRISYVLKDVNLEIKKGSRIGFVGDTGSGKSTLVDIIMGLLPPSDGEFLVDSFDINKANPRSWQAHIAHVPQSIYLADASIAENIALGCSLKHLDMNQVVNAAKLAQIDDAICEMPNGYQTIVGEHGIRLSGGQRQRIGIARAMFKKADVLIFDEATSALDEATENMVTEAIRSLSSQLTILTIAHREESLRYCTEIYRIHEGNLRLEKIS